MAIPFDLFGAGSIAILIVFFIGEFYEKPYIQLLAGGYGMSLTLAFLADGTLCANVAYSGGFQCNAVSFDTSAYALIPTAFTLICFVVVIVRYRDYKKGGDPLLQIKRSSH